MSRDDCFVTEGITGVRTVKVYFHEFSFPSFFLSSRICNMVRGMKRNVKIMLPVRTASEVRHPALAAAVVVAIIIMII